MLTFKKSGYTRDEVNALYNAMEMSKQSFSCASLGCDYCSNKRVCADITRLQEYLIRLMLDMDNNSEVEQK